MKVSSFTVARPAPFDRAPVQTIKNYSAFSLAPASTTARWSYTVPAGKRAVLTSLHIFIQRNNAASGIGQNAYDISIAPLGVGATTIVNFNDSDNTLQRVLQGIMGQGPLLNATDVVTGNTRDGSTGGTNNVNISATFTEFDA